MINPYNLDEIVTKLPNDLKAVDAFLWNQMWRCHGYLRAVAKDWFGWSSATLAQVVSEIMKRKGEKS